MQAACLLEANIEEPRSRWPEEDFYNKLKKNKVAFQEATAEEVPTKTSHKGTSNATKLLKQLKYLMQCLQREDHKSYLKDVVNRLEVGALPEQTIKKARETLQESLKASSTPLKIYTLLKECIPDELLKRHASEGKDPKSAAKEVILSEYLIGK